MADSALLIACGAIARELVLLRQKNGWDHLSIQCLPAELHNTPTEIPEAVDAALREYKERFEHVFVAYADCGTGGLLDPVLEAHGVERLPGAHCYEFFAGHDVFETLHGEEPGTFYLTDFLARHFDRLVVRALKLDTHPELKTQFFGNYRRLVYLAQTRDDDLARKAEAHAAFLGLEYVEQYTGLDPVDALLHEQVVQWQN